MCVSTWGRTRAAGSGEAGGSEGVGSRRERPLPDLLVLGPGRLGRGAGAARGPTHLPDVVEIAVRHLLLGSQLLHLVEQHVHLELGAQVLQPAVAEGLSGRTRTGGGSGPVGEGEV